MTHRRAVSSSGRTVSRGFLASTISYSGIYKGILPQEKPEGIRYLLIEVRYELLVKGRSIQLVYTRYKTSLSHYEIRNSEGSQ